MADSNQAQPQSGDSGIAALAASVMGFQSTYEVCIAFDPPVVSVLGACTRILPFSGCLESMGLVKDGRTDRLLSLLQNMATTMLRTQQMVYSMNEILERFLLNSLVARMSLFPVLSSVHHSATTAAPEL